LAAVTALIYVTRKDYGITRLIRGSSSRLHPSIATLLVILSIDLLPW